jgi:hypothetical protein
MRNSIITKVSVKDGDVFYPKNIAARHNHRRVVGVIGDRVFYSVGGGRNFSCKLNTFRTWIKGNSE